MDILSKKPEELAREKIDEMLRRAGWQITNRDDFCERYNACAVEEGLMKGNREADYVLHLDGKAIGILEAKRSENKLGQEVADQALGYSANTLDWCAKWQDPLPLVYLCNGDTLLFCNRNSATEGHDAQFVELKRMHSPKEAAELGNVHSEFAKMPSVPEVGPRGLRQCQHDAIENLELSFKHGKKKALIILATGAGKTFTACTAAYRLLNYTPARKVLFLVDRNNLGKQAEGEFGTYKLTETQKPFTDEYCVQRLFNIKDIASSNVVISTIQRLFATLTGQDLIESEDDESELDAGPDDTTVVDLSGKLQLPKNCFDLIIVDECHRSIYGKWRKVLEYFNTARIVGLTATPTPEAYAFFNNNRVVHYSFEDSVRDNVNVAPRIYRIRTDVSENGGKIQLGEKVEKLINLTGEIRNITQEEEQDYTNTQLDRSVVNPAQIRLVVDEYKKSIYSTLFPEREKNWLLIPKTLFFAKTDSHADYIISAIKESFSEELKKYGLELPKEFVQKITCKAGNSNQLIQDFRNEKKFRIAVTVTLVATGTDVKPLEVLVFMRDINSSVLYEQMKGRGCRTLDDEKLRLVTPNANSKDCFYIIDAVGVTEKDLNIPRIGDYKTEKVLGLREVMERLAHGEIPNEHLNLFAGYLSKIQNKACPEDLLELNSLLAPSVLADFIQGIFDAITGRNSNPLPPFENVNEANVERKELISAVIDNPKARRKILEINKGFVKILNEGKDSLIYAGFSIEEAKTNTQLFEEYIQEHKEEVEALRIIYNNEDVAITSEMLNDLKRKLLLANSQFSPKYLWDCYETLFKKEGRVKPLETKEEVESLTAIIQLVKFALHRIDKLVSLQSSLAKLFNLYCGKVWQPLSENQIEVLRQVADFVAQNGCVSNMVLMQYKKALFLQMVKTFGAENVNSEIERLTKFLFGTRAA